MYAVGRHDGNFCFQLHEVAMQHMTKDATIPQTLLVGSNTGRSGPRQRGQEQGIIGVVQYREWDLRGPENAITCMCTSSPS